MISSRRAYTGVQVPSGNKESGKLIRKKQWI
nr:MAG TPA: hypothetical protein [Caudoviricetes sp.]